MKFTAFLLTIACLSAAARGTAQTIKLDVKDAPLEKVFAQIKKQSGYSFVYYKDDLAKGEKITLRLTSSNIDEVLQQVLKDQPLSYTIVDKTVVIKQKSPNETPGHSGLDPESFSQLPPPIDIKGRVVDENGNPVAASVQVKGTNKGTSTNNDGYFELKGVDDDATLVITGVGIEKFEVKVDGKTDLALNARTKITKDEEIIINKGYYSTKQRENTGNVTKVSSVEIQRNPVGNPLSAVQGRVPGLLIKQNFGAPGTTFSVRLRGQNSIANGNDPLFVVDGVPFISASLTSTSFSSGVGSISPLNSINPDDIESIEVLKDADATSIYGSRGSNGVILINTKKSKVSGTSLDVNVYAGAGKVTRKFDLMNTQQYLAMRREAFRNDGIAPGTTDYDLNGKWDTTQYTDWQKVFIGGKAHITNAQLSFSGGTGRTQFTLGGGYRKETTVFPGDYFDKQISVHYSLSHSSSNNRFQLNLLANYMNNNNQLPTEDFTRYITLAPDAPALYDQFGNLNWQGNTFTNPFAILKQKAKAITNNLITNTALNYKIIDGLSVKASVGYNTISMRQNNLYPLSSFSPQLQQPSNRSNQMGTNSVQAWIVEPQLNYDKRLGKHQFNISIGSTYNESIQETFYQTFSNFSNDNLIDNIGAAGSVSIGSYNYTQYRYNAGYGRLGYMFKDRYIVNLTGRRDGSSRFGPGKQFGNFGAVGTAWIFSDEKFVKNNFKFLSFGKIRGSYGTTGSDQLSPYQYLSSFSSFSYAYMGLNGLIPSRIANPNYRWEQLKKLEFALDLGFLNNQVNLSTDWYRNRTDNQLVGYPLPSTAGFTKVQYNLPAIIENSGWEVELNVVPIKNKNIIWSANANLSVPRNKLISYPNIQGSPYSTQYAVGQSLSVLYRFGFLGIDPATGAYTFEDKNKDGSINSGVDQSFFFFGVKYHGGFQNVISYKQWEFSFLFQFAKQSGLSSYSFSTPGRYLSGNGNQPLSALLHWQKPGDDNTSVQKYTTKLVSAQTFFDLSNGRIDDASFARLKNLSLSWEAPKGLNQTLHSKKLRLYIEGQNLLTITNYSGINPEVGSGSTALPPIRMLVAGFQLGL